MEFGGFVEKAAEILEVAGAIVITLGFAAAFVRAVVGRVRGSKASTVKTLRLEMTHALLLGLELLVAADIIKTTVERSLEAVAALGLIILIRTFLTWTILVEEQGRWPWQSQREPVRARRTCAS